jgi:hypothetical protein
MAVARPRESRPRLLAKVLASAALLLSGCAIGGVSGLFSQSGDGHDGGAGPGDAGFHEGGGSDAVSNDGAPSDTGAAGDQQQQEGATPTYSVGGVVSGLVAGDSLPLLLSGGGQLSVTTNGPFAFANQLPSGSPYQVSATNPTSPIAETCLVTNASGTIANTNVTNVQVACTCVATTCAAQGKNCGSIADGCGGTLPCGTCTIVPETCGGGGVANVCGACGVAIANTVIASGQSLTSCDGRFTLAMQASDGNLVLYMGNTALWSAGTAGNPGAYAAMQGDGNFVVYSAGSVALWSSGTAGNSGAYLDAQSDGNLVVYSAGMSALWNSGTCCH